MKSKPRTTYTVFVRHLNQYSRKFIVSAKSEYFARQMIREMISALPLDQRNVEHIHNYSFWEHHKHIIRMDDPRKTEFVITRKRLHELKELMARI